MEDAPAAGVIRGEDGSDVWNTSKSSARAWALSRDGTKQASASHFNCKRVGDTTAAHRREGTLMAKNGGEQPRAEGDTG
jgi:hypothetical protein